LQSKILKAHFVKDNQAVAPKTHDLVYLANKTTLSLNTAQKELLVTLMIYQLEGRYPDYPVQNPGKGKSTMYLVQTKELLEWLEQRL